MYQGLSHAAHADNTRELERLLQDVALTSEENVLHKACKRGDVNLVKQIIKLKPILAKEMAKELNHEGLSAMHLASAVGDVAMVRELVKLDSQLCLVEGRDLAVPLHSAVIKGKIQVIEVLISACPESVQRVTAQGETVLHLSLRFNKCSSFKVLMEQLKTHNQVEHIINNKDNRGNTVVHLATSGKHCEILEVLFPRDTTTPGGVSALVNIVNHSGFTALDIFEHSPNEIYDREIGSLLRRAGAMEGSSLTDHSSGQTSSSGSGSQHQQGTSRSTKYRRIFEKWPVETMNVQLMVPISMAGITFTAAYNPPNLFLEDIDLGASGTFQLLDVLMGHQQLPTIFFLMIVNTIGFIASMGAILNVIWPLPLKEILSFVMATIFIIYVLLVNKSMPAFSVLIGSVHLLSWWCVWVAALTLISTGLIIRHGILLIRSICRSGCNCYKLKQKSTIEMV